MTRRAKQMWIAAVAGFAISVLLFWLAYLTRSDALAPPQFIGFYICMLLRGVESASNTDYALIALPINGLIYAAVIYFLFRLLLRERPN